MPAATPVEEAIVGDAPSTAAYPGNVNRDGIAPAYVAGWPHDMPMPMRFPTVVAGEALSSLRSMMPGGNGAGESLAGVDPDTDIETSPAAVMFQATGRFDPSVARAAAAEPMEFEPADVWATMAPPG